MLKGIAIFVLFLVAFGQARYLPRSLKDQDVQSLHDFQLVRVMQHGIGENSHLFREAEIEEEPLRYFAVPVLKTLRETFISGQGFVRETIEVPNPEDKQTVLNLADMSYNAYENLNTSANWRTVPGYNVSSEFGWYADGLQGYVFGTPDRSILIMSIKGTTFKFFGEGGTSEKDRLMDNLMFSCCCAAVDDGWKPVCDCATSANTCNQTCLETRMTAPDTYFSVAQDLYLRLKQVYPFSAIWFTGHSLGGSLASLLGAKNLLPVFAYEAPGELLYAQRIGLEINPSRMEDYYIYHFGNDADPIYLGTCNGRFSTCYQFSYAMETKCHVGHTCTYDGGFVTNINNHRLEVCIERFYLPQSVPKCFPQNGCTECTNWKFS